MQVLHFNYIYSELEDDKCFPVERRGGLGQAADLAGEIAAFLVRVITP